MPVPEDEPAEHRRGVVLWGIGVSFLLHIASKEAVPVTLIFVLSGIVANQRRIAG